MLRPTNQLQRRPSGILQEPHSSAHAQSRLTWQHVIIDDKGGDSADSTRFDDAWT